jgi:hypothetical protein
MITNHLLWPLSYPGLCRIIMREGLHTYNQLGRRVNLCVTNNNIRKVARDEILAFISGT